MKCHHFQTPLKLLALYLLSCQAIQSAPLNLYSSPLFVSNSEPANVLVIVDNSNSMDEDANGSAVGGASANSKSEIARNAVSNLISTYTGKINMGLMAYQQTGVVLQHLHNSPYDVSFNPANYDPAFTGARDSLTKRFRVPNLSNAGTFIYYNVALPFYAGSDQGSRYCYSVTADFDNGSESYPGGPWDNYRCFRNKTTTADALPTWNNGGSETAAGFTSYAFGGGFSPTDSDLAQNILDFGRYITWDRVSLTWFANTSPGKGYLHTPIALLDASQASTLNTKLATSQFTSNGPTNPTLPLQNAGLTPLEGTLETARNYFAGSTIPANQGGPAPALPESCGKDFVALLTDGLPSTDANGTVTTNPTAALADVATAAGLLNTDGVESYIVGFALPVGTDPTALDQIAVAGGTGTSYLANDPSSLQATFDTIFTDILAKTGASSSAATNSSSLSTNSFLYLARFNSGDWSGQLLAKSISSVGLINATETWDASVKLNAKPASSRVILTYDRDSRDGMAFRWSNINALTDTSAKDALNTNALTNTADTLGSDRVDFIRGGTGGASSASFRQDRVNKLGDIVHSTPYYVGAPSAGYSDTEMSGYSAFRTAYLSRSAMIYAGANDGMLHGFDALTGEEKLAYIPREVYPELSSLTASGYGTSLPHRYYVDASPMVADADVNGWKTILAGGLNAGGQGIYALDVTNPSLFSEASTAASNTVLWEFTDEDDVDLGYTYNDPVNFSLTGQSAQIAKMANGKWAVILGNGYNNTEADGHASSTGHAYLYILFIEDGIDGTWTLGSDYIKIDTGEGSTTTPNGLATPTPRDNDGDGDIDVIYAGDLEGNLWKFDVSSTDTSDWGNSISGNTPLFTAKDSSNNRQPITTAALVTRHPNGGFLVGFGTGKYIELTDLSSTATQTFYAIRDLNANISNRSNLAEQTVLTEVSITDTSVTPNIVTKHRVTSQNAVTYPSQSGWFMDLPESGERVDVNPVLRAGRFVFVTRTPSVTPCTNGGDSWLMELDYLTGGRLDYSPFDVNNDGVINDLDNITVTVDVMGTPTQISVPVSGYRSGGGGMMSSPATMTTNDAGLDVRIMVSSKDGEIAGGNGTSCSGPDCDCSGSECICTGPDCTLGRTGGVLVSTDPAYKGRTSWEEIR